MQRLQAPAVRDELVGQLVEQLRMARPIAVAPKSFAVSTMPRPKWYCQMRFTITRAVSGCSGSVSHLASSVRGLGVSAGSSGASSGTRTPRRPHADLLALVLPIAALQDVNRRALLEDRS